MFLDGKATPSVLLKASTSVEISTELQSIECAGCPLISIRRRVDTHAVLHCAWLMFQVTSVAFRWVSNKLLPDEPQGTKPHASSDFCPLATRFGRNTSGLRPEHTSCVDYMVA